MFYLIFCLMGYSLEATASKGINFKFVVIVVMVMMTRGSTHKRRLLEPLY